MMREFWISTFHLSLGVIKRCFWLLSLLILESFDLAERLLGVDPLDLADEALEKQGIIFSADSIVWSLFGFGLFLAVALTYYEVWQKQTIRKLAKAKRELREHAEKGHQIFDYRKGIFKTPEGVSTREIVEDWSKEGFEIAKKYLVDANDFQRRVDSFLDGSSPNEVPREGHAINVGIGWLEGRARQITESDIKIDT
jgi:hypothetical protein